MCTIKSMHAVSQSYLVVLITRIPRRLCQTESHREIPVEVHPVTLWVPLSLLVLASVLAPESVGVAAVLVAVGVQERDDVELKVLQDLRVLKQRNLS